jgi:hypothetical protein
MYSLTRDKVSAMLALAKALTARAALIRIKRNVGHHLLRLGIMAPDASEGASLEEYYRSYTRSVVHREALNIKYISNHREYTSFRLYFA